MLSERMLTAAVRQCTNQYLKLKPTDERRVPAPVPGQNTCFTCTCLSASACARTVRSIVSPFPRIVRYLLPSMRKEMMMLKDLGYDFDSLYVGGGTRPS